MRTYYDNRGVEIKEFDLLKFYHFTDRKGIRNYMYKWVRIVDGELVAMHLDNKDGYIGLYSLVDYNTVNCTIVTGHNEYGYGKIGKGDRR